MLPVAQELTFRLRNGWKSDTGSLWLKQVEQKENVSKKFECVCFSL